MSTEMQPSICSRPVYGTLSATTAPAYLMVADADGGAALLELIKTITPEVLAQSEILYIPGSADHSSALQATGCPGYYQGPSIPAMLPRLARSLERLSMGTEICLAGSESLIGLAMQTAMAAGIDHEGMQTEHRGSLARRMQCVHCKGITENVTTQPAECAHCGLLLLVRDHYSRRYAAFQGVNINAEDPSDVPPKEEVFR